MDRWRLVSPRNVIVFTGIILLAQTVVILKWKAHDIGAVLSDILQLMLGIICVLTSVQAFRRSGNAGRYFWRWLGFVFCVWCVAQGLGAYIDVSGNHSLDAADDMLFFISVMPFGMLLFLDPEHELNRFDRIHLVDFVQVSVFWAAVFLYFSGTWSLNGSPHSWVRSFAYHSILAGSFLLRAFLTNSQVVRAFFGRMALFLFLSGVMDSYASFPNATFESGHWFDLVWSVLLCIPVVIAATWNECDSEGAEAPHPAHSIIMNQFFPLLYPFFSCLLLALLARTRPAVSVGFLLVSFAGVGTRMLIIQHRLLCAQKSLQFEATHDSLTCMWNHAAIIECLQRETLRSERTGDGLGIMMIDLDHFKSINDRHGHMVGDMVLHEVARRLTGSVRSYDSVGRYGGEEFLVITPNCGAEEVLRSAERLRSRIANDPIPTSAGAIHVTVSIGVVAAIAGGALINNLPLLRMADSALYCAKNKGRDRVEIANPPSDRWEWSSADGQSPKPSSRA